MSNFVTGVCEYGDAILALHMSTGGGPGFSASLHAFDRAGDSITSKTWEGIHGLDMSVTSQGIYIVGNAQDTTELDGHVVHPYDVWLGKLRYDTPITGSPENNTTLPAAYPNPFHDRCEIAVSGVTGDSVLLTDVQGKVFTPTFSVTGEKLTIIRENLASGIYLCRFRTEYGWKSVKLAIF